MKDIKCYDKDGNELKEIMEEYTYNYCHKIIVSTGYCYYSQITEAGTWIYEENDGRFVKII